MSMERVLVETLKCLSSEELEDFNLHVELEKDSRLVSTPHQKSTITEEMVEQMMEKYGEECVELTTKIFKKMKRSDLVQRLSGSSQGAKALQHQKETLSEGENEPPQPSTSHQPMSPERRERDSVDVKLPTLTQRVEMVTSDIELLIETLADLNEEELMKLKDSLRNLTFKRFPDTLIDPLSLPFYSDHQTVVFVIILLCGQYSVEITQEALKTAGRDDLVKRMVTSSSGYRTLRTP